MRVQWDDHEEEVYQRALCHHIAGTIDTGIGDDNNSGEKTVESVTLKALFVETTTTGYNELHWYDTARQPRYARYQEHLLYVYKPKNTYSDSKNEYYRDDEYDDDDYGDDDDFYSYDYVHAWDQDGIWWDKKFYMYNDRTKEYTITDYKWDDFFVTTGVTKEESTDNETTDTTTAGSGASELQGRGILTSAAAAAASSTMDVAGQDEL